jgi:hypothetical protein
MDPLRTTDRERSNSRVAIRYVQQVRPQDTALVIPADDRAMNQIRERAIAVSADAGLGLGLDDLGKRKGIFLPTSKKRVLNACNLKVQIG